MKGTKRTSKSERETLMMAAFMNFMLLFPCFSYDKRRRTNDDDDDDDEVTEGREGIYIRSLGETLSICMMMTCCVKQIV